MAIVPKRLQLAINGLVTREHMIDVDAGIYLESYLRFTDWLGVTNINYPINSKSYIHGSFFVLNLRLYGKLLRNWFSIVLCRGIIVDRIC